MSSDNRLIKHGDMDKYDGYMPNKPEFFHDDYYISGHQDLFHTPKAFGYRGRGRGFSMGVQKKMWKASGRGIKVDGSGTGKSDL